MPLQHETPEQVIRLADRSHGVVSRVELFAARITVDEIRHRLEVGALHPPSRHAREQDRRREREARARGDEFRRYTYGDAFEQPRLVRDELRALLPV